MHSNWCVSLDVALILALNNDKNLVPTGIGSRSQISQDIVSHG